MSDRLEEAKSDVEYATYTSATANALIVIAEELRKMNELTTLINTPIKFITGPPQGDFSLSDSVYPFGGQV